MVSPTPELPNDFVLPGVRLHHGTNTIPGPSYSQFTARFGTAFPEAKYLDSEYGRTAVYPLLSNQPGRHILILHGLSTPALGMLPLVRELQSQDPSASFVLFDLWGHGLSSTPLVAHTPPIFHFQILQVLSFMGWSKADIVGYSFGGSTAASFTVACPWAVESLVLLAPVGLMTREQISGELWELLERPKGREKKGRERVFEYLEGGPLVVPDNCGERMRSGEVVAQGLRAWELEEHRGFPFSVFGIFRDAGVTGREEVFRKLARLETKQLVVLADGDDVCNNEKLNAVGMENAVTVANADHAFIRSARRKEVAAVVGKFWKSCIENTSG